MISFRALERKDLQLVHRWLSEPHVRAWWHQDLDFAAVRAKYEPRIDRTEPTRVFIIEQRARPIGWIQWYRWRDYPEHAARLGADPSTAGIDLALGEHEMLGLGLGSRAVRYFVRGTVFADPAITACVTDPEERNFRSVRAFEKAGFERIATVQDGTQLRCVMRCMRPRSE
jgi:RimJ/RimL family protein N-acetyltransferase